ncbi:nuclear transport factor 2 family protein [Rhizobacter sp. P5_C2]
MPGREGVSQVVPAKVLCLLPGIHACCRSRSTNFAGDPALRTRDELREHFRPNDASPRLNRKATNIVIHETKDPEVIIAEFEYQGTVEGADEPFSIPGIFVIRVRDGQIVSSRDYLDHLTSARVRGQLDWLVAAMKA